MRSSIPSKRLPIASTSLGSFHGRSSFATSSGGLPRPDPPPYVLENMHALVSTNDCGSRAVDGHQNVRSEEHTSELQSPCNLVCRLLLEKKKKKKKNIQKKKKKRYNKTKQ